MTDHEDPVMEAFSTLATALGHTKGRIEWPAIRALFGLLETHRNEVLHEAAESLREQARRAGRPGSVAYAAWAGSAQHIDPEDS